MRHDQGIRFNSLSFVTQNRKIETHKFETPDLSMNVQAGTGGNASREINLKSIRIISIHRYHLSDGCSQAMLVDQVGRITGHREPSRVGDTFLSGQSFGIPGF